MPEMSVLKAKGIHINILNHMWRGKSSGSCPTVTFALLAGRCSADPLEGSANSELWGGTAPADTSRLARFLQLTFRIMPTQPASVFTTWVEEATGEASKVRVREDNTVQEHSRAWSLAGFSFFSICCYLLAQVSCFSWIRILNIKNSHYIKLRD